MTDFINGVCTHEKAPIALLKEAGVEWVREGVPYPYLDRRGDRVSEEYRIVKETIKHYADAGLKVMASALQPGSGLREPDEEGNLVLKWHAAHPEWFGEMGTDKFLGNFEQTAAWLANDLKGMVQAWQIGNELDWMQFAGPLNPKQACDLILAGARGVKSVDPAALVGHNMAGCDKAYFFFAYLFTEENRRLMDYCGIDGYYGTWGPGGPGSWADRIRELYDLTGTRVILNEWGFASAGGVMSEKEKKSGLSTCQLKKWAHTWGNGHTPLGQADFIEDAFAAMASRRDMLLGQFYFRWADQEKCWQCGQPDCPAETAWGLVDRLGNPKPSFKAYKKWAARLRSGRGIS